MFILRDKHQHGFTKYASRNQHLRGARKAYSMSEHIFIPKLILPESDTDLRNALKVDKSIIEGLGLFADRDFPQFGVIWFEDLKAKAAPESGGPLRWANHSDDPNAILLIGQAVSLVALKDIKTNDEITYNYGVFGHTGHKAACNCGQDNCKGFFTLREEWGEKK
jgi:SET domain-containing protein